MYQVFILSLVATAVSAGNLAIGLNSGGYGGFVGGGSTISQQSTSTSIANAGVPLAAAHLAVATPAIATAPIAVAASPVISLPSATSSQSRVDVINSSPFVSQLVSSVPVNVAVGGGYGYGHGYGSGLVGGGLVGAGSLGSGLVGNGLVASSGLTTGSVNSISGANIVHGHGLGAY